MKIFINQDEIDFTFENEKTLGDIFTSVEAWSFQQGYSVTELFVDGDEFYLSRREEWSPRSFKGSEEIRFTALTLLELKAQNLQTLLGYTGLVQKALKEGNPEALTELLKEYGYIEGSFEVLLDDSGHSIRDHMRSLLENNGFLPEAERSEENVRVLLEGIIMLEAVIQGRLEEITDPPKAGRETFDSIQMLLPRMEEVSLMLQTGKDREAMDTIIRFSELFQKLLRIYANLPQETAADHQDELKPFITEMSGILKELAEAFSAEDSVLMGDLMEYEIMPRMENFPRFFETMLNRGD